MKLKLMILLSLLLVSIVGCSTLGSLVGFNPETGEVEIKPDGTPSGGFIGKIAETAGFPFGQAIVGGAVGLLSSIIGLKKRKKKKEKFSFTKFLLKPISSALGGSGLGALGLNFNSIQDVILMIIGSWVSGECVLDGKKKLKNQLKDKLLQEEKVIKKVTKNKKNVD